MVKKDFEPQAAAKIKDRFNPPIIAVDWGKVVGLDHLSDPDTAPHFIEKTARHASMLIANISKKELKKLKMFSVVVDVGKEVGRDPVREIRPDDTLALGKNPLFPSNVVGVVEEDMADALTDPIIASRLYAVFVRDEESIQPRFTMALLYPTTQFSPSPFDTLTIMAPREEPEVRQVFCATPAKIAMLRDLFYGDTKKKLARSLKKQATFDAPTLTRTQ